MFNIYNIYTIYNIYNIYSSYNIYIMYNVTALRRCAPCPRWAATRCLAPCPPWRRTPGRPRDPATSPASSRGRLCIDR